MSTFTDVPWREVRIGDVLTYLDERVDLDDAAEYLTITVKRRHGGLEERERILGHQIQTKKQFRLIPGAFIISRVQCWHQAYAIVPDDIPPNMIASINYDQFAVSPKVDRRFFWWLSHSPYFTETVRSSAFGVVIEKMVFSRDAWLDKQIPLPPFEEQQRIVARIEALATKIHEARTLRRQAVEEAEQIMATDDRRIWNDNSLRESKPLETLTLLLARGRQSEQGDSEHFLIKTQHVQQGRYIPTRIRLAPHAAARVRPEALMQSGDILIACSAAGCLGRVARYEGNELVASTDTHVAIARPNSNAVDPDYLYAYLKGSQGQHQLRSRERGDWQREKVGFRLTELNLKDLRAVPVPIPPLREQRRIVAYLNELQTKINALRALQAETSAELDALMPSILDKAFRGEL